MPSGLFEPRARPIMKPPEQLYPKQKEAQFNIEGRPNHALFYTTRHNFYQICYVIYKFVILSFLNINLHLGYPR